MPQDPDQPNHDANPTPTPEPMPSDDKLTDALLREHARAGNDTDETFVAKVESALDDTSAPEAGTNKIVPITAANPFGVSPWWRIAAAIVALAGAATGGMIWLTAHQNHADLAAAATKVAAQHEEAANRNAELQEHAEKLAANAKSVTEELMARERALDAAERVVAGRGRPVDRDRDPANARGENLGRGLFTAQMGVVRRYREQILERLLQPRQHPEGKHEAELLAK